jgi:hypothetical protein
MAASKRYFALFGPKASGKTAYLGALYGSGGDTSQDGQPYHVGASEDADDPTHAYLGKIFRALRCGAWPDSTSFERLETLKFCFTSGELARDVVLPDVAGELTQRAADAAQRERLALELKHKILDEYADYQGFLIVVPADTVDSSRASEYKWEVDALLNALRERTPEGGSIARPFAILVTKWDLVETGAVTEASEARAVSFWEATHPELASGLKLLCQNLRVFPVSATGPCPNGYPPKPLRPTNLAAPIAWLIETADRVQLKRAIAYVERHRETLFRRDPDDDEKRSCWKIAQGMLANFLEDVPHGHLAEEARARRAELQRIAHTRQQHHKLIVGVALGLLVLAALLYRDHVDYNHASALLHNASPELSSRAVIARVGAIAREPFRNRPVGHLLRWWPRLRAEFDSYRANYERRSFEELEIRSRPSNEKEARELLGKIDEYLRDFQDLPRAAKITEFRMAAETVAQNDEEDRLHAEIEENHKKFRTHPDDDKLAALLVDECESFFTKLPSSRHLASVQAILADARATVRTQERARSHAALKVNLNTAADAPFRCYELCAAFLKEDPSHPQADEVRRDRDSYLHKADNQAWSLVTTYALKNRSFYPDQIEKADAYLANTQFTVHRSDAARFKAQAIQGYDRSAYEAICSEGPASNHPAALRKVRKLCTDYLNASIPGKTMANDVERWARWFDDWKAGKELHVRVVMIRIERGSIWHHSYSYSNPWVHAIVRVGSKSDRTGDKTIPLDRDVGDFPGDRLGPFTWKWGDPEVAITLHHKDASPVELTAPFDAGDEFKVRHLHGLTTFDGGKISVRLACPEVDPPVLPPYRRD